MKVELKMHQNLSDKRLKKLALDIVNGKVFGSWNVKNEKELGMVFMVLIFSSPDMLPKDLGSIYEYLSEAGPTSINGYPVFYSCNFLSNEETQKVQKYCAELKENQNQFLNEELKTHTNRTESAPSTGAPVDPRNSYSGEPRPASDSTTHVDSTNNRLLALFKRVSASDGVA